MDLAGVVTFMDGEIKNGIGILLYQVDQVLHIGLRQPFQILIY